MKVLSRLAMLFYVLLTMVVGVVLILFVTRGPGYIFIDFNDAVKLLSRLYFEPRLRAAGAVAGIVLLWLNYIFIKSVSDEQQRERTIAFDNPTGRVTVSLNALEDLARRVIAGVPEVKEVRSSIHAGKKGLVIDARLVLNTDVNIPEMTAHLQNLVKMKVQDTIGIEETPTVRIHISKIIPGQRKAKRGKEGKDAADDEQLAVPYQGYRV